MEKFINRFCPGILPLSYDQSLSYYEVLCKLREKVNELIEYFNSLGEFATEEYVNAKIAEVLAVLEADKAKIYAAIALKLDRTEFETFLGELQLSLNSITEQIGLLRVQVNANTQQIEYNFNWLKNYIDTQLIDLEVINPFTGQVQPIQTVINYLADLQKQNALTAAEYDAAELTAATYDALQLTAIAYDIDGKNYIS